MKRGVDYIGVGVGAVIISRDKKIFVEKRGEKAQNEKGKWESPGGGLEFGESFEECIIREMEEEFGFEIEPVEELPLINHLLPDEKQHWVAVGFICKIKQGEPHIVNLKKASEIRWVTLQEMETMDLAIVTRERLNQVKKRYPQGLPDLY